MDDEILEIIPEVMVETTPVKDKDTPKTLRLDGVVIGVLLGFTESGRPLVAFPGNQNKTGIQASSTAVLNHDDIGREVALLFEGGNPECPIVIGRIQHPEEIVAPEMQPVIVEKDGDRLLLKAKDEITLKCGKASITLTRAGKIIIRGKYLLSRSSGVNRIKGGSVQIN